VGEELGVAHQALGHHHHQQGAPGVLDAGGGVGPPQHPQQHQQEHDGGDDDLGMDPGHVLQSERDPLGPFAAGVRTGAGGGRSGGQHEHGDADQ
jgi:hypothetical protein